MGLKKKKTKKDSKRRTILMTQEDTQAVVASLTSYEVKNLTCRAQCADKQNIQLRAHMHQQLEDRDGVIADIEHQSERHKKYIEKLIREQARLEKEKDCIHADLSMKIAHQEREITELRDQVSRLNAKSITHLTVIEECHEVQVKNAALQDQVKDLQEKTAVLEEKARQFNTMNDVVADGVKLNNLLPVLLRLMRTPESSLRLQEQACIALANICRDHSDLELFVSLDGTRTILTSLRNHHSIQLQINSAKFIKRVAGIPEGQKDLIEQDAGTVLLDIANRRECFKYKRLFVNICRALHGLLPKSQADCFGETEIMKYILPAVDGDPQKISAVMKSADLISDLGTLFAYMDVFPKQRKVVSLSLQACLSIVRYQPESAIIFAIPAAYRSLLRHFVPPLAPDKMTVLSIDIIHCCYRSISSQPIRVAVAHAAQQMNFIANITTTNISYDAESKNKVEEIINFLGASGTSSSKNVSVGSMIHSPYSLKLPVTARLIEASRINNSLPQCTPNSKI